MSFFNREGDIRRVKSVLSGEPNLVYFVYGPINSGKTSLLMRVFEELSEEYRIFYINFRGRDVERIEDLMRVLFSVRRGVISDDMREFIKEMLKEGARALKRLKGIPVPEGIFDILFRSSGKVEDIFAYLEEYFEGIVMEGWVPVLVIDELQMIKRVMNATGQLVLDRLFNFLVRLTKETHLCHILCATSDCLFIEDVYNNARLGGRSDYILVDDLCKEEAFKVYEEFGFREKEVIWEYIGGKMGDMVRLYEKMKQGYSEREGIERMLEDTMGKIRDFLEAVEEGEKGEIDIKEVEGALRRVLEGEVLSRDIRRRVRHFLVEENLLFYNPVRGVVRYQSELIRRAVSKLLG
jgi:AAA+ ATPase superfamily predicted ATPase